MRPRVGISLCLLGEPVRWDGGHKRDAFLVDVLGPLVTWVPVCPEVELGLGTPREPIRLEGSADAPRLVATASRHDHTAAMARWAKQRVAALSALDLAGYILKQDSPSCGMAQVSVHREQGPPAQTGVGAFARALMDHMPSLPIEEEGRLHDRSLREHFLERLFARDRELRMRARGGPRD